MKFNFKIDLFISYEIDANESFIEITEPSGKYKLEVTSNKKEVQWLVKYSGHPIPRIVWHDVRGNEIPWSVSEDKSRKYEATKDDKSTTLKIRNPKIADSGFYVLSGDNGQKHEERKFQLLVKGKRETHCFIFHCLHSVSNI